MPLPKLSSDQLKTVSGFVATYISDQRDKYLAKAEPISAAHSNALRPFFSPDLLAKTRVVVLKNSRVENPPFYPMVKMMGIKGLPDSATMAAITFNDVVVSHEKFSDALLFHELVHVEQYRQLGIRKFSELYVRGFLNGGSYEAIPLEVIAYTLDGKFQEQPEQHFSVEEIVGQWIADEKF